MIRLTRFAKFVEPRINYRAIRPPRDDSDPRSDACSRKNQRPACAIASERGAWPKDAGR